MAYLNSTSIIELRPRVQAAGRPDPPAVLPKIGPGLPEMRKPVLVYLPEIHLGPDNPSGVHRPRHADLHLLATSVPLHPHQEAGRGHHHQTRAQFKIHLRFVLGVLHTVVFRSR